MCFLGLTAEELRGCFKSATASFLLFCNFGILFQVRAARFGLVVSSPSSSLSSFHSFTQIFPHTQNSLHGLKVSQCRQSPKFHHLLRPSPVSFKRRNWNTRMRHKLTEKKLLLLLVLMDDSAIGLISVFRKVLWTRISNLVKAISFPA